MEEEMKRELAAYVKLVQQEGWAAGEPVIEKHEKKWPEFRRWASMLWITIQSEEYLREHD